MDELRGDPRVNSDGLGILHNVFDPFLPHTPDPILLLSGLVNNST